MPSVRWLSVLLLGLFLFRSGSRPLAAISPAASVDLHLWGYTQPIGDRYRRAYDFLQPALAFVDPTTLAVSFFVKNGNPGLSRRNQPTGGILLFHTVLLDASGHLVRQQTWGNADYWEGMLPLLPGEFFVQLRDHAFLYDSAFRKLAERQLDYVGDILPRFAVSPSGRTLYEFQDLWDRSHRRWITKNSWLDPKTLQTSGAVITDGHSLETVSDQAVAYSLVGSKKLTPFVTFSRGNPAQQTRLPARDSPAERLLSHAACEAVSFVNDSVLAITGGCSDFFLLHANGEIESPISRENLSTLRVGGNLRVSADGRRIAFARSKVQGKAKRISEIEVLVYDLPLRRIVFRTPVAHLPECKLDFALANNGTLLAVESDNTLDIWPLPVR